MMMDWLHMYLPHDEESDVQRPVTQIALRWMEGDQEYGQAHMVVGHLKPGDQHFDWAVELLEHSRDKRLGSL
jgi:hypothetical protein